MSQYEELKQMISEQTARVDVCRMGEFTKSKILRFIIILVIICPTGQKRLFGGAWITV